MTPEQLKTLLRRIATHLNHLQETLYDAPLHAARYSQTDSRKTNSEPAAPTDLTTLDYLHGHVDPVIRGWCYNLANSHMLGHLPHDQPTSVWTAWLARHATTLLTTDYAQDCISELQELEAELRARIHPDNKHPNLPEFATINDLAHAMNKTPDAMRKWCERKGLTKYTIGGKVHYKTSEATTAKNK